MQATFERAVSRLFVRLGVPGTYRLADGREITTRFIAKQAPRQFDRGTDLHTQSNPLPMCHRPGVLIKLTA